MSQPTTSPDPTPPARGKWGPFIHLEARFYMNYREAILRAAKPGQHHAVDVDVQVSADGTPWAAHWPTVGGNHLYDPEKVIPAPTRLVNLSDYEIGRLRSATGKKPHTLAAMLYAASRRGVRIEAELKTRVSRAALEDLFAMPAVRAMHDRGDLQVKTLALLPGPIRRLRPAHETGFTTLLTFTNYHGPGINAARAWPVVDYVRGTPKWTNVP